jgi:hypothetical protein
VTAAYVGLRGEPTCDLRSNIAAKAAPGHLRTAEQHHGRSGIKSFGVPHDP